MTGTTRSGAPGWTSRGARPAQLLVDVFGRPDAGGWYASTRLVGGTATSGLLAYATLRFIHAALTTLGGQPLDGAIRGLRLSAGEGRQRAARRAPLIGRYSLDVGQGQSGNRLQLEIVRWHGELVLKQAAIASLDATAQQLEPAQRADLRRELLTGLDRWVSHWLRPSELAWDWAALWRRWVDGAAEPWHK